MIKAIKILRISSFKNIGLSNNIKCPSFQMNSHFSIFYQNQYYFSSNNQNPSRSPNPNEKYSQKTMNKLKADAKEFAGKLIINEDPKKQASSKNVYELNTVEDWKKLVIGSNVPIVLDCYADWCQPCKQLTPLLEKKCADAKGDWILIKINIEKLPQIASALQLKSVPTVLLINNGNVIDGFTGVDQNTMNKFFDGIKLITGVSREKNEFKTKIDDIEKNMVANQKYGEISRQLLELLKNDKIKNIFGGRIISLLSYCSIKEGKKDESLKYTYEVNQKYSDDLKRDPSVLKYLEMVKEEVNLLNERMKGDPKLAELIKKLDENPQDNSVRYELAELQFKNGIHQEAINNCLDILKIDRNWEGNKGQKLLITIFGKLGSTNSLVIDGRKRMQRILY